MKKHKKNRECDSSDTNKSDNTNKSTSTDTKTRNELLDQLNILYLSSDTLKILLLAIFMNYYFLYYSQVVLLDQLNNTKCKDNIFDASNFPRITNVMVVYATGIFLEINHRNLQKVKSVQGEKRDGKAIQTAYRAYISAFLVFLAALISRTNIEV